MNMQDDTPLITTIITTYKRPELLKQAVTSVLEQTYPNFQVCVYDNASGDETGEIMRAFIQKDPRVKYHCHAENIGMMANYEYALSRVNTPYFSFLSDDDFFLPCFYETALKGFEEHPDAAFSACGVTAVDETGKVLAHPLSAWRREGYYPVPEGILEMIRAKGNLPIPTGILFQHHLVKDIIPDWCDEIRLLWDPDYLLQIAAQHPIVATKKSCAVYLSHSTAFSSSFYAEILGSTKGLTGYMKALNKMLQNVKNNPYMSDSTKQVVQNTFVKMIQREIGMYMCRYIIRNKLEEARETKVVFTEYYKADHRIKLFGALAATCKYIPLLQPIICGLLCSLKNTIRFFRWLKGSSIGKTQKIKALNS